MARVKWRTGGAEGSGRRMRLGTRLAWAAMILCLPVPALPEEGTATTRDLLAFIRFFEAPGGYDAYERRIPLAPPRRLTEMSVAAVMDWQLRVRAAGAISTAAGAYQIIYPTLDRLVQEHGLDPDARFGARLQDRLARLLIAECGERPGSEETEAHAAFGNCLAATWAALPVLDGPDVGLSAFHGVAGNRAQTTPEAVLALLAGKAVPLRRAPGADTRLERLRRAFRGLGPEFGLGLTGAR